MDGLNKVEQEILRYLQVRPTAGDTLEGIAQWWLMKQRLTEAVSTLQQALKRLESGGFIHERRGADGRPLYTLAKPGEEPQ